MTRLLPVLAGALLVTACGKSHKSPPTEPPAAAPAAVEEVSSGIDPANFDTSVRPQDDLYRAINGKWLANTPIPADRSNYGAFIELEEQAAQQVRAILEELAGRKDAVGGSNQERISRLYAGFMDEKQIETLGLTPLEPELSQIDAVKDRKDVLAALAELQRKGVTAPLLALVHQDAKNPGETIGDLRQGGLSLPNRDFYLEDDAKFVDLRQKLAKHIATMYRMAGWDGGEAAAQTILELETKLAKAQWDKVALRDPAKTYNAFEQAKLPELSSKIDWTPYLEDIGFDELKVVLVGQPSYVKAFGDLLASEPIETWKTYLRWRVLHGRAGLLPKAFVDEDFAFFGKTLNGIAEIEPRWKRGVGLVEAALGEAVGELYVARHFPAENKARMEALVQNLIRAYGTGIDQLEWMSPETKKAAREKLSKFTYKIAYPKIWRDYSTLAIQQGDLVGNTRRAAEFEYQRELNKLGKPIDRDEWVMTPQTVNAYYNPELNEIVFPAGILQPPFFNSAADDAANYGAIGAVIGHEVTHGFDDQGSQYDGDGRLRVWWTPDDLAKFKALAERLAAQYGAYEPVKGHRLNGHFTLGENIADLGGLTISHAAWKLSLNGAEPKVIDGLTGEQRFFMGWAQAWRRNYREENLINRVKTDPHSPSEFRCNGVVVNMPEFAQAFGLQPTDKLYKKPEDRIKIW
ncbi:MAG TPA: M13-type metalloendopeptidase [Nevskiaceae bacterium]|nr:M13-type metalloendopeptidase [Nevskiaceae bacterium]